MTAQLSFQHHWLPPAIIRHGVLLFPCFEQNYRNLEDLLAARRVEVSYETVWRYMVKAGRAFADILRQRHSGGGSLWHLDEKVVWRFRAEALTYCNGVAWRCTTTRIRQHSASTKANVTEASRCLSNRFCSWLCSAKSLFQATGVS
jgi:hypothetical protein